MAYGRLTQKILSIYFYYYLDCYFNYQISIIEPLYSKEKYEKKILKLNIDKIDFNILENYNNY